MPIETVEITQVYLDEQGYDEFGYYWGLDDPLWCASITDPEGGIRTEFFRAETLERAHCLAKRQMLRGAW